MPQIAKGIVVTAVIFVFVVTTISLSFAGPVYPGGGEIHSGVISMNVNDNRRYPMGQHNIPNWDTDGDFEGQNWTVQVDFLDPITKLIPISARLVTPDGKTPNDFDQPGITVDTSNVYNLEKIGSAYVALEDDADPVVVNTYEKQYVVNGQNVIYKYNLLYYGLDITYKTSADVYYKDPNLYGLYSLVGDYGYFYEDGRVDASANQSFSITPWNPVGIYNSTTDENNVTTTYQINNGWAGILDAQIYEVKTGFVDETLEGKQLPDKQHENYGHEIVDVYEVGTSLNMYYPSSGQEANVVSFQDPQAIDGVPSSINIETYCSLKAGAQYHVDGLGHWDAIAIRNVKVQYKILIKVAATIEMTKLVVTGSQQQGTTENNSFFKPQVAFWSDFDEWMAGAAEYWNDLLQSPNFLLILVAGILILMLIIYLILRMRGA